MDTPFGWTSTDLDTQALKLRYIAQWVNTHDDGTPFPRASVVGDVVVIKSTYTDSNGKECTESAEVRTLSEARDVLGY